MQQYLFVPAQGVVVSDPVWITELLSMCGCKAAISPGSIPWQGLEDCSWNHSVRFCPDGTRKTSAKWNKADDH